MESTLLKEETVLLGDLGGSQDHWEAKETDFRRSSRNDSQNHTPNWPTQEADASAKIRMLEIQEAAINSAAATVLSEKGGIISISFLCIIQFQTKVSPRCIWFLETKLNVCSQLEGIPPWKVRFAVQGTKQV